MDEVREIIGYTRKVGIEVIDTATAYGSSEQVLGETGVGQFSVVTKIPAGCTGRANAELALQASLTKLKVSRIYGWLYHQFEDFVSGRLAWEEVTEIQNRYGIPKVGFSLYDPSEWKLLRDRGVKPQIIQVPYNILDRRFEGIFDEARDLGTEVHVRSAFLQGLFFKNVNTLDPFFSKLKPVLSEVNTVARQHGLNMPACLLRFVVNNPLVDRVVFGVLTKAQLQDNFTELSNPVNDLARVMDVSALEVKDAELLNPSNWP